MFSYAFLSASSYVMHFKHILKFPFSVKNAWWIIFAIITIQCQMILVNAVHVSSRFLGQSMLYLSGQHGTLMYNCSSFKLAVMAIYFACVNFFLFVMIAQRTIISGSTTPIFAIFSPNKSVLGADDRPGPLFPISQRTLRWQPIL